MAKTAVRAQESPRAAWPEDAPEQQELPDKLRERVQQAVRQVLERAAAEGLDLERRDDARNRCDEMSRRLVVALRERAVRAKLVMMVFRYWGEDTIAVHHTVVRIAGQRALDLTANQYADPDERFPVPYVTTLGWWKGWLNRVQFHGEYKAGVAVVLPDDVLPDELTTLAELRSWVAARAAQVAG